MFYAINTKIDTIVVYVQRYERGHEKNFVSPMTGIHLATITPSWLEVRVVHQQIDEPDFESDVDLIALTHSRDASREDASQTRDGSSHVFSSESREKKGARRKRCQIRSRHLVFLTFFLPQTDCLSGVDRCARRPSLSLMSSSCFWDSEIA